VKSANSICIFVTPCGFELRVPDEMADKIVRTKQGREDMRHQGSREVWKWALEQEQQLLAKEHQ
jgi:hypothetical protein